jgi:Flp pilus assembly pilin Flp
MGMRWLEIAVRMVGGGKESGATAVEYALVASLIAGAIVATAALIAPPLVSIFLAATDGL